MGCPGPLRWTANYRGASWRACLSLMRSMRSWLLVASFLSFARIYEFCRARPVRPIRPVCPVRRSVCPVPAACTLRAVLRTFRRGLPPTRACRPGCRPGHTRAVPGKMAVVRPVLRFCQRSMWMMRRLKGAMEMIRAVFSYGWGWMTSPAGKSLVQGVSSSVVSSVPLGDWSKITSSSYTMYNCFRPGC